MSRRFTDDHQPASATVRPSYNIAEDGWTFSRKNGTLLAERVFHDGPIGSVDHLLLLRESARELQRSLGAIHTQVAEKQVESGSRIAVTAAGDSAKALDTIIRATLKDLLQSATVTRDPEGAVHIRHTHRGLKAAALQGALESLNSFTPGASEQGKTSVRNGEAILRDEAALAITAFCQENGIAVSENQAEGAHTTGVTARPRGGFRLFGG